MLDTLKLVAEVIFPETCAGCGKNGKTFCSSCMDNVEYVDPQVSCPLCGRFLGYRIVCGECLEKKRNYSFGFFLYYYTSPIRNAIHALKFEGKKRVARILIRMASERIFPLHGQFDYLVPIPVTKKRLKERGFNQAYVIAVEISRLTRIPVHHDLLIKVKETKDQYTLDSAERERNVKGAFAVKNEKSVKKRRILLVDDLFTTGYTLMEAVRALRGAHPEDVCVFALARAL